MTDAQASLDAANAALEEQNAAIARLEEDARVAIDAIEQLTMDKQELTDNLNAAAGVKAEYEAKLSENEAMIRSAAELNAAARQQKQVYDELKANYDESRRLLDESNAKVAALEESLKTARETAETLTKDVAALKAELADVMVMCGAHSLAEIRPDMVRLP